MKKYFTAVNGPQTIGNSSGFWVLFGVLLLWLFTYPLYGSIFHASNLVNFFLFIPLALGLSLLWGYSGILSFGQMAFFGVAGYTYGIIGINIADKPGGTLLACVGGIAAAALLAYAFGYFVFYGRVSAWIIPVLTLVLTLILETFFGQTAGYQWRVGKALLGGYNGMTNIPSLQIGGVEFGGFSFHLYYLVVGLCLLLYLGLRILVNTNYGFVLVAMREDSERTRMLGHDVRQLQIQVFTIAAVLAGLSGVLYVWWGNYITPSSFGLLNATLPVLWVAVGGKSSLTAVIFSTVFLEYLSESLSIYGGEYAFVILGFLLLLGMMFFPEGVFLSIVNNRRFQKRRQRQPSLESVRYPRLPEILREEDYKGYHFKESGIKRSEELTSHRETRTEILLETKGLTKAFGGIRAVDNLDFAVSCGELRCLIGPNGAGKTTLFRLLMGMTHPDAGVIYYAGEDISRLYPYQRVSRRLSMKFQTTRIYHNLTVRQNLQIPLRHTVHEQDHLEALDWILQTFGLRENLESVAKNLTHGQQQWLEMCMALATQPALLLLDEPTAGMTPEETQITAKFVKTLNKQGVTILVVEHDMAFVREIAQQITVLHQGKVFAQGSLEEIENNRGVQRIYLGE